MLYTMSEPHIKNDTSDDRLFSRLRLYHKEDVSPLNVPPMSSLCVLLYKPSQILLHLATSLLDKMPRNKHQSIRRSPFLNRGVP